MNIYKINFNVSESQLFGFNIINHTKCNKMHARRPPGLFRTRGGCSKFELCGDHKNII